MSSLTPERARLHERVSNFLVVFLLGFGLLVFVVHLGRKAGKEKEAREIQERIEDYERRMREGRPPAGREPKTAAQDVE